MNESPKSHLVLWRQVGGVAAIQGAITLSWMLYRIFLPKLLEGFGFPGWDKGITILEDVFGILLEPIMGSLSDNQRRWLGTRFPLIMLGVILSSALLILIAVIFIFGQPMLAFHWILPVALVAWALAMAVFRAPAIALLGQYATKTELPQAMSVLILVGGLAGGFRPIASDFILSLGPVITFSIASFVLLGAVLVLRKINPDRTLIEITPETPPEIISIPQLGLIAITGMGVAMGTRLMMGEILPKVLKMQFPNTDIKLLMTAIAIGLAIMALPAGKFAVKIGNIPAMLGGLALTSFILIFMVLSQNPLIISVLILVFITAYSLIANGAIPFALSLVPAQRGGLGVGIYFGGFSLAMSVYGFIFMQPDVIPLWGKGILGAIAFIFVGVCLIISEKLTKPESSVS